MLKKIREFFQKIDSEKGQGAVEYALVLGFVAVIAVYLIGSSDLKGAVVDKGVTNAKAAAQGMETQFNEAKGDLDTDVPEEEGGTP